MSLSSDEDFLDDEDKSMLTRIFDAPDERVFLKSLSAVLFLRLICPAIISPMEWGSLHQWSKLDSTVSSGRHHPSVTLRRSVDHPSSTSNATPHPLDSISPSSVQVSHDTHPIRRGRTISHDLSYASYKPPPSTSMIQGCPTAFLTILAFVLCDDEPRLRRSISLSAGATSSLASPTKSSVPKSSPGPRVQKDLLDYFKPPSNSLGNESDDALIATVKEIKKKFSLLAQSSDELAVSRNVVEL